jgi:hypothetical protein
MCGCKDASLILHYGQVKLQLGLADHFSCRTYTEKNLCGAVLVGGGSEGLFPLMQL